MSVTREEIRRIATLAELELDEAAAAELELQLSRILDYVAQLGELPRASDEDADRGAVRLRRDEEGTQDRLRRAIADFAPALRRDLFVVPKLDALGAGGEE